MSDLTVAARAQPTDQGPPPIPQDYLAEVDLEYARWSEMTALIRMLTPDERIAPGYFRDPDWSVKDLVAHLGAWLEEAATQLTNIAARSYEPRDVDIDARNADASMRTGRSPGSRCGAKPRRRGHTCSSTGSRSVYRVTTRTGGCGRQVPSTTVSTLRGFGHGLVS